MCFKWNKLVPELIVSDFEVFLHFYAETLGFQIVHQRSEPSFAYLDKEGVQFMLEAFHADGWNTGRLKKPFGRGIGFQIEWDDIQPVYERLNRAGYALFRDLAENWYETTEGLSGQREFLVQDPDGYLLRFSQYLGDRPAPKADERDNS